MVITSSSNIHRTRRSGMNCVFRSSLQSQVLFELKDQCVGPMCRWHLLSGESGFMKELVSWLTNHPHLAQALEQWRDNTSGAEKDRHVQVKNGLASARHLVELVESFLRVVREEIRGGEEHSNVAAFSAGPSSPRRLSGRRNLCRRRAWRSA